MSLVSCGPSLYQANVVRVVEYVQPEHGCRIVKVNSELFLYIFLRVGIDAV